MVRRSNSAKDRLAKNILNKIKSEWIESKDFLVKRLYVDIFAH